MAPSASSRDSMGDGITGLRASFGTASLGRVSSVASSVPGERSGGNTRSSSVFDGGGDRAGDRGGATRSRRIADDDKDEDLSPTPPVASKGASKWGIIKQASAKGTLKSAMEKGEK